MGLFDPNICPPGCFFPGSQVFSRRLVSTPAFALIRAALRQHVDFTFALALVAALQVCSCPFMAALELELVISQRRLHVALGLAFAFTCRRDLDLCSPVRGDAFARELPLRWRLWFALALLRQRLRWQLVYVLVFLWQPLNFVLGHALRSGH